MKNQEDRKKEQSEDLTTKSMCKEKLEHIQDAENKISQLSEEEQEELRAEARERYNRLLGCGG